MTATPCSSNTMLIWGEKIGVQGCGPGETRKRSGMGVATCGNQNTPYVLCAHAQDTPIIMINSTYKALGGSPAKCLAPTLLNHIRCTAFCDSS